jgi:hypothetical protein
MLKLMPPQNPTPYTSPTPPKPAETPYDFMMGQPPSKSRLRLNLLGGQSFKRRLLLIGGVAVVLVIIAVVLSSLLGGSSNTLQYVAVTQDQNELSRVAGEASDQAVQQTTQNFAESVVLSLGSAQQQLLAYLKSNGRKVSTAQLGATKDTKTDQELTAAAAASNYDVVFAQVMQTELNSYMQDIKTVYPTAGPKGKTILQNDFNGAKLLLIQANALTTSLQAS